MSDERLIKPITPFGQEGDGEEAKKKAAADNRRRYERYEAAKSLVVIPVMPDGSLDWERRRAGYSVNVSKGGLGIEVAVDTDDLAMLQRLQYAGDGRRHIGQTIRIFDHGVTHLQKPLCLSGCAQASIVQNLE